MMGVRSAASEDVLVCQTLSLELFGAGQGRSGVDLLTPHQERREPVWFNS